MLKGTPAGKIIFIVIGLVFSIMAAGQTDGDYQTRASGNWNSNTTWQVFSGGAWVNCAPGDYPGATPGARTAYIADNRTVTVTAAVPNTIEALNIDGGGNDSYVQFNAAGSLRVTGETYLNSNSNNDYKAVLVDAGSFRTGSVSANSGRNNQDAFIRISTGEVIVDGNINLNANIWRTYILFTGAGNLYVGGAITGGNITGTADGGPDAPTSGTVIYNGTSPQVIGEYEYFNLTTDNSSGVSLSQDITVNNTLTMTAGNISTGASTLILTGNSPANLVYTSGTIIGALRRAAATTGSDYLFPVGSAANHNPLTINFSNLTAGDLEVSFQPADPGAAGLPLDDGGIPVTDRFTAGYWSMAASNGLASINYDVALNATGFGGLTDLSRIITRAGDGTLSLNGNHGSVSDPDITRTAMNGIAAGLAIGKGTGDIITHPSDYTGCDPSFTVVAGGTPPVTYQWQVDEGSGFTDITDNAIYSGATSSTLTIPGATEAMTGFSYRCIVTDALLNSATSNSALLTFTLPDVYFGYRYSMELTVDAASGTDDLTDFPLLIDLSNTLLRSESNGGHVASTDGYDIIFTGADGSRLFSQTENYDPATGSLTAWVRIPVLSASSTTTINILYGNNSITTDQSSDNVWTSNYKGVWHLNQSDYTDGTIYNNDGTENATTAVTGKIAGAGGFNGTTSYIQVPTNGFVPNDNNQTISIWARYTTAPTGNRNLISFQNTAAASAIQLGFRGGRAVAWKWGGAILADGGPSPSINTWHHYVYTYDGTTSRLYIDGVEAGNSTVAPQTAMPSEGNIGRYNPGEYIDAWLDEPRFSITPRSAGWVLTEYNNQNDPSSFVSVGPESDNNLLSTVGVCSSAFLLNQGFPTGGIYSGTGVSGTNFNASVAGVGTHTITYTYTDVNGCSNSASKNIVVTDVPGAPPATDIECCITNILDLESTGINLTWYSDATLTTVAGTGTPFATGQTAAGVYTYYVTQTVNGCESAATEVSLTIHNAISIDMQPMPADICEGEDAIFTVAASGYNITFQWLEDGVPISDGAAYSGTTTSTLTVINPGVAGSGKTYSCVISGSCGPSPVTSVGALLTVTPLPVGDFSYPGSPYCPNGTNPLPQFSGGGVAGTFSSTAGLVFVSTATGEVDLAASTPGTYTVTNTIAAAGACGVVTATSEIEIISEIIWTGASGSAWNNSANWLCGLIPGSTTEVRIPSTANNPVIGTGQVAEAGNLVVESGATLTTGEGTLRISGTITNNGTINAEEGTLIMCGTAAQIIGAGIFENNRLRNLTADNAAGVTLTGQLTVSGEVTAQSGDIASDGFLLLESTASQTALINGSGSGTVTGDVTMQRYLPSAFGYKYFSSPFTAATVGEFGDDMDLTASFPAFYRYDESRTASGWVSYANPAGILEPMTGYSINFGASALPHTADVTGEVNNGTVSLTLYNNNNTYTKGFNLVGNPYPSPIDWDAPFGWTKTNIDNALYFLKASSTDRYGGTYSSYINGISSDGQVSNIIASMQGFFIHVSDGSYPVTATLSADNDVRITNSGPLFFKSMTKGETSLMRVSLCFEDDTLVADPVVIYADTRAKGSFDGGMDALKMFNTALNMPNLYAFSPEGKSISIKSADYELGEPLTVPLGVTLYKAGTVRFTLDDLAGEFENSSVILSDQAAGVMHNLTAENDYTVTLPAGTVTNRFVLMIGGQATTAPKIIARDDLFTVYFSQGILFADIKEVEGGKGTLKLTTLTGHMILSEEISAPGHYQFFAAGSGVFCVVSYQTGNKMSSRKIIIGP